MGSPLEDNTIIPHYLTVRFTGGQAQDPGTHTNVPMRYGEVREIIYADDPRSRSKKYTEYRVEIEHRDGDGPGVRTIYPNCRVGRLFGGAADFFRYTLRANPKARRRADGAFGIGSKVMVVCLNGDITNSVIVGGLDDENTAAELRQDGHNLVGRFNGIEVDINDAGELTLTFAGATQEDGTLRQGVDAAAGGTQLTFDKSGGLLVKHNNQTLYLDHQNQSWALHADQAVTVTGEQSLDLKTQKTATITAANTKIGGDDASEALVKGTTYRGDQSVMNQKVVQQLEVVAESLTALGAILQASASMLSSNKPIPAGGALTAANPVLLLAAGALQSAVAAISDFEGQRARHLSEKNTTD